MKINECTKSSVDFSSVSLTFSSSLRLAVKLLASDRCRAHSMGGGACLEVGGASAVDGVELGRARRKASKSGKRMSEKLKVLGETFLNPHHFLYRK